MNRDIYYIITHNYDNSCMMAEIFLSVIKGSNWYFTFLKKVYLSKHVLVKGEQISYVHLNNILVFFSFCLSRAC